MLLSVIKLFRNLLLLTVIGLLSCQSTQDNPRHDVHSYAKPAEALMTHLDLTLAVDFASKQLDGKATLHIDNKTGTNQLHLDARDLTVDKVTLGSAETATNFKLGAEDSFMGQPLIIDITPETKVVNVYYKTSPSAVAVQWLSPEQTSGKKHPFLFTQSQAILARTWVPCQDSPGIRFTYNATVKVDTALMAVMSAENGTERNDEGVYHFTMKQPIPAYLLALAVGDIEFRSLGPTSGVYAEPAMLAKAAFEFADTEKMITAAEALYGDYRWEKYDIIVLPPSFPFGGMENPRLTFATPTILAGDRSLVALIAHELAHSWSGNLVTNATWNDFWLNEGFTCYFEHRIMEAIYGKEYAGMLEQLGYQDAMDDINDIGPSDKDTHLYLNLQGRDPDDGMTGVAYEKGRFFLQMLENTFGREKWDAFLRDYFDRFAFKSMTSSEFVAHLEKELIKGDKALAEQINIDAWVYGPGMPDNCPVPQSGEFDRVNAQINTWLEGTAASALNTDNWTTHHWLHFLRNLPKELSTAQMTDLDNQFHFTKSGNSEIHHAWLMLAIKNSYAPANDALENFLTSIGRLKFLRPLYQALAETAEGKEKALKIYKVARSGYHPVSYSTIDELLGWQK